MHVHAYIIMIETFEINIMGCGHCTSTNVNAAPPLSDLDTAISFPRGINFGDCGRS